MYHFPYCLNVLHWDQTYSVIELHAMETSYGGTSFTQIFLVLEYFVRCIQTHFASNSSAWEDMYIEILSAFSNLNFLERNMSPNNVKL